MHADKVVLITGATGNLGKYCCKYFLGLGYQVRALVRDPNNAEPLKQIGIDAIHECSLPHQVDESAFAGDIEALIHCAYDTVFQNKKDSYETNIEGSKRIIALCRKFGVGKFVFLSSLSADAEALSFYGQSKVQIEELMDKSRDAALRSGLIISDEGLFQRMRQLVRMLPVIPIFYGGKQRIQTIWIEDLCKAIHQVISKDLSGIFMVAEENPVDLKTFYRTLGEMEGKKRLLLPFPGTPTLILVRMLEWLGLTLPISSENLLGLKALKSFDVSADLQKIGVSVGSFNDSLQKLR